ncbi:alpha-N-acetylglucosaminidase [Mucilaginibacter segetis]|uniref:Alpha-N-acetylglucosaminidase n=1 Tax=Mucilaginibacter segetis TaxID=2793071 RepID=A0A934PUM8_9SPHI|nr:alpha-N-acetylglucosaminidase [Mucilaginibacter segetis]MBK0379695.1 alpha-N-acetylglucosaminidase [Mucilaginibacter segetis]
MKKQRIFHCVIICAFFIGSILQNAVYAANVKITGHINVNDSSAAVYALIKRIVPKHAAEFQIKFIPKDNDKDVFELESSGNKIILSGNNGISIASSLNYYLKNYAHCDISWNGTNLNLPKRLPVVPSKVRRVSPYKYRYYFNYCTFNYTMSWWNWDRWQWEIDWMALNGINMPLAITGQNAIWQRVYKSLNFTDDDLASFFSGPAYFNWFWMGNLDGWGGPLPQSIITGQEELQKKILAQERGFGMTPILPSFTGHVPSAFQTRYPESKLKKTKWSTFSPAYVLDPDDPMFTVVGKKFLDEEIKTFGTDHYYTADTFNEMIPPSNDSLYLDNITGKVYQSMLKADKDAHWIMQGWLFYHDPKFWHPKQVKALLNAVPDDRMIILDLWSENHPVWKTNNAYYGKPWIWCMLLNFGGNISMYGRMDVVAQEPAKALKSPEANKISGIGLTPEAIEQNPVMYELMLENAWTDQPIDAAEWLKGYAWRRYGSKNQYADKAWEILHHTVYTGGIMQGGPESIITGRPTMAALTGGTRPHKNYAPKDFYPAWGYLVKASSKLKSSDGFQYDMVDVTRQALVNYADTIQRQFAAAYAEHDQKKFKILSDKFLMILDDVDNLLGTRKDFLLGKWLNDARKWGATPDEKDLFEKNARDLITLWGDEKATLHEYASKQWAGMISGFYKPRWEQYFKYVNAQMALQKPIDQKQFETDITHWEWNWVNSHETYTDKTHGSSITEAQKLYKKYHTEMDEIYL